MKPPLHIAVLECDTPLEGTRAKYGTYTGVFTALLLAGASEVWPKEPNPNSKLVITGHDVLEKQIYPLLEDIDAVLITGSRFNSYDDEPWILKLVAFVRKLLTTQSRVRVLGICFGHQIIGRAMSCPVIRNEIGWETSVLPVTLTAVGSRLFEGLKELRIMQMHRDIVSAYPSTLEDERGVKHEIERLGATKECEVQGMYVKGRFMGVQGHPEFTEGIVREILTSRWTKGIFDDAEYEEAMKRVGNKQDGVIVAKAMLRFLLDD